MAQVSYGTITITDTTDITDVYLQYCIVADDISASDISENSWFILSSDITVQNKHYYILNNSDNKYYVVTPIGSENPQNLSWYEDKPYPEWQSGYQIWIRRATIKEGISEPEFGIPYLDTAVNQINNNKLDISAWTEELSLRRWWFNRDDSSYPEGMYMAHGIDNVPFDRTNNQTYGFNILNSLGGLYFRYNDINLTTLNNNGLKLYGAPFQNSSDNSYIQNSELISLTREGLQINRPSALNNQNEVVPGSKAVAVTQNGFSVYNNEGTQVAQYGDTILLGKIINNTVQDGIQISDAELGFYSKGQKTAYVNKQKLYIPYSVVLNEMIVGTKEEYRLTNDNSVQTDKDYYIKNGEVYEKVANPSGNPQEHGWYELIENSLWAWKVTDGHLRLVWNGGDVEGV